MDRRNQVGRDDLRTLAGYQKGILICILVYLALVALQFAIPPEHRIFLLVGVLPLAIAATVLVFLLATKLYAAGPGVVLAFLTLVPLVGLFVLLIINGKATGILKEHGIHVGLLGARMSDIR